VAPLHDRKRKGYPSNKTNYICIFEKKQLECSSRLRRSLEALIVISSDNYSPPTKTPFASFSTTGYESPHSVLLVVGNL